jgi:alpha-beta hydrolase superfamily lysophospholipase
MTEATTTTIDGARGAIVVHTWKRDDGRGRYAVLLAHGLAEHMGRYGHVAEHLLAHGAAAVTGPDHLGHGASEGPRAEFDDIDVMVADLHAVADRLRAAYPGLPVVLVGHSLGGIIATRFAQQHHEELAALVLSAPVIGGNPGFEALLAMDPMPEVPLDPAALSRDSAVGRAYAADPLVHHGAMARSSLQAIFSSVDVIARDTDLGDLPTLWIHGENDPLAPYDVTAKAFERTGGTVLEQKVYAGAMHEIFNETNKEEVLADVTDFLDRHVP